MNVEDIVSRAGGEFVSNKAQAVLDGTHVELAYLDGQVWVLTEQGQALAAEYANEAAAPKTRKKAAPAVESAELPAEPEIVLDQPAAE